MPVKVEERGRRNGQYESRDRGIGYEMMQSLTGSWDWEEMNTERCRRRGDVEMRRENGEVKSVRRQTRQGGELLPKPSISVCCASQRNLASCKVKPSSPSCCQCLSEVSRLHLKCSSRPGVLHYILCAHGLTHWGLPNVSWDINMCTSKCSTGSCILSVD